MAQNNETEEFEAFISMMEHNLRNSNQAILPLIDLITIKKAYLDKIKDSNVSSYTELINLMETVNNELEANITEIREVKLALESLFKEDLFNRELAEDITQQKVDNARQKVEQLSDDLAEKQEFTQILSNVESLMNRDLYNNFGESLKETVELSSELAIGNELKGYLWPEGVDSSKVNVEVQTIGNTLSTEHADSVIPSEESYLGLNEN